MSRVTHSEPGLPMIIFYVTGQKTRCKKSYRCTEQVREAERRKKKRFCLENDSENILEQSQSAVERDNWS